jgi:hypothetical protein
MSLSALGLLNYGSASAAAATNPAIARCCEAWKRRYEAEKSNGESDVFAAHYGDESYRDAMPALKDYEGIRDFIACTAHGMLYEAIQYQSGTQLLYAAQVALTTLRYQPQKDQTPKKQNTAAR